MAIRNIVKHGDDVLTKKCRIVEKFDERLETLIEDLFDTLYDSGGAGLAAPQVGVMRRVAVIDIGDGPYELVNPEIIATEGEQTGPEGCLSYPGKFGIVTRPMKVKVKAQDRRGEWHEYEGEELLARAFCHETDHLDGNMFMDLVTEWVELEDQE
ncbi:MAG: peptide deformylase [Ruminococcaceae bacterium]|nr:peptide deformylase [Oscillospiraceae bacterium]